MVPMDELKHMGHGRGYYWKQGWAQVGQVDPTGTNYGKIGLMWGLTIEVKVNGIEFLGKNSA